MLPFLQLLQGLTSGTYNPGKVGNCFKRFSLVINISLCRITDSGLETILNLSQIDGQE